MGEKVKEISVFVDESGTFDPDVEASRFYLVCMVFHDQAKSIADNVQKLNDALAELGLPEDHAEQIPPLPGRRHDRDLGAASSQVASRRAHHDFRKGFL